MKRSFFFLFLLFLAACNFRPDDGRPGMDIPCSWRFDEKESGAYANIAWWEQFKDPHLSELIQTALANNQDLQVASARVLEFFAKYQVSLSQFYPQIYLDLGEDRLKLSKAIIYQPVTPPIPRLNYLFNLLLKLLPYEVDFWGRIRNSVRSAEYDYFSQVNNRRNVIVTLVSQLAAAYFKLMEFDAQLKVAQDTYEFRKNAWEMINKRYEGGLISQLEVKQAESQAEDAEISIKNFTQFIAEQEDFISTLLGSPPISIPRSALSDIAEIPCIPSGLPSDILENRPDILQAEDQMISANALIGVARANFFPLFTITGVYGQESSSLKNFLKEKGNLFDLGIDTSTPLYTGGKLTGQLSEAEAFYLETCHNYQQTVLNAFQEVEDALIAHKIAKEKIVIQNEEVAALADYLRISQLRYDNGLNDYLTVLNAETSLFQVQLNQVNTQSDILVSLVNLFKALGQGWDVETCPE